jgi:hypothetical protein
MRILYRRRNEFIRANSKMRLEFWNSPRSHRARNASRRTTLLLAVALGIVLETSALAVKLTSLEGSLHGFPALREPDGKKLADGEFAQWLEAQRLHVKLTYQFADNRRIEEIAEFRQTSELIQEKWSWRELREGKLFRRFEVDFGNRRANAAKQEGQELKSWSETVNVEPGQTFAGFGFVLAIKNLRERLIAGEKIELKTVGFTPRPHSVAVEISHAGLEQMRMSDRTLRGDRFIIRPKIPRIAQLFINVSDTYLWLVNPVPAGFLRMEGPLLEPGDPVVRVDLLGGGESGPAKPVTR